MRFSPWNLFVALAVFATTSAKADIVTYDLSGTLDDGGSTLSVNGQFDYNTWNDAVFHWSLTVSGLGSPFCGAVSPCYTFQPGSGASATFTPDLLTFTGLDTGGYTNYLSIVPGNSSDPLPTAAYSLDSASLLETVSPADAEGFAHFTDGSLSPAESVVPEPCYNWVIAAALLLRVLAARRAC